MRAYRLSIPSLPRSNGLRELEELEKLTTDAIRDQQLVASAPVFIGGDWSKAGSDRTIVFPVYTVGGGGGGGVPPCPIAQAVFPQRSETDRIWDLIVLAAESSRYG